MGSNPEAFESYGAIGSVKQISASGLQKFVSVGYRGLNPEKSRDLGGKAAPKGVAGQRGIIISSNVSILHLFEPSCLLGVNWPSSTEVNGNASIYIGKEFGLFLLFWTV